MTKQLRHSRADQLLNHHFSAAELANSPPLRKREALLLRSPLERGAAQAKVDNQKDRRRWYGGLWEGIVDIVTRVSPLPYAQGVAISARLDDLLVQQWREAILPKKVV